MPPLDPDPYENIPNRIMKKEIAHIGECTSITSNYTGEYLVTSGED